MKTNELLLDAFGRVRETLEATLEGLDGGTLAQRPGGTGNSIAWLAWHLGRDIVAIPKSVTPSRIVENLESVELHLTDEELERIDALDRADGRAGRDPADSGH